MTADNETTQEIQEDQVKIKGSVPTMVLRTDFFANAKISALNSISLTGPALYIRLACALYISESHRLSKKTAEIYCLSYPDRTPEQWLSDMVGLELIEQHADGSITCERVNREVRKFVKKKKGWLERQAKHRENKEKNMSQNVTRDIRVTARDTDKTRQEKKGKDINIKKNSAPPDPDIDAERAKRRGEKFKLLKNPETGTWDFEKTADEMMIPEHRLKPDELGLFMSSGRKPLWTLPELVVSRADVALCLTKCIEYGLNPRSVLDRCATRVRAKIAQGQNSVTINPGPWLSGWALNETLDEKRKAKDLERSENWLLKSQGLEI